MWLFPLGKLLGPRGFPHWKKKNLFPQIQCRSLPISLGFQKPPRTYLYPSSQPSFAFQWKYPWCEAFPRGWYWPTLGDEPLNWQTSLHLHNFRSGLSEHGQSLGCLKDISSALCGETFPWDDEWMRGFWKGLSKNPESDTRRQCPPHLQPEHPFLASFKVWAHQAPHTCRCLHKNYHERDNPHIWKQKHWDGVLLSAHSWCHGH